MHEGEKELNTHTDTQKKRRVFLLQPPQSSHPLGANFTLAAPFFALCIFKAQPFSRWQRNPFSLQQNIYRIPQDKSDLAPTEFPRAVNQFMNLRQYKVNCNLLWNAANYSRANPVSLSLSEELRRKSDDNRLFRITCEAIMRLKSKFAFQQRVLSLSLVCLKSAISLSSKACVGSGMMCWIKMPPPSTACYVILLFIVHKMLFKFHLAASKRAILRWPNNNIRHHQFTHQSSHTRSAHIVNSFLSHD